MKLLGGGTTLLGAALAGVAVASVGGVAGAVSVFVASGVFVASAAFVSAEGGVVFVASAVATFAGSVGAALGGSTGAGFAASGTGVGAGLAASGDLAGAAATLVSAFVAGPPDLRSSRRCM